jgi:hypothetical protein
LRYAAAEEWLDLYRLWANLLRSIALAAAMAVGRGCLLRKDVVRLGLARYTVLVAAMVEGPPHPSALARAFAQAMLRFNR